jgi:hypothetical protein
MSIKESLTEALTLERETVGQESAEESGDGEVAFGPGFYLGAVVLFVTGWLFGGVDARAVGNGLGLVLVWLLIYIAYAKIAR